jgi:hypothetical protein
MAHIYMSWTVTALCSWGTLSQIHSNNLYIGRLTACKVTNYMITCSYFHI